LKNVAAGANQWIWNAVLIKQLKLLLLT
jgi:hypothetical protein